MPVPGALIEGKYEILAKIREGGMGTIYKVRHRHLDEIRVIKVMRGPFAGDSSLAQRFSQEARTLTRLKHHNIGAVHDFSFDADGTAYMVLEYINGVNLFELLERAGPPRLGLTLEIAHQTLSALGYLHRRNIVHRDIAPDNIMLSLDDRGEAEIKLIDLGIAKALDNTVDLTSNGVFVGKMRYSSPEQLGGLGEGERLDGRSDLYSLGVVLYQLLTGQHPYPGTQPRDVFAGHLFLPPTPFAKTDPAGRVPQEVRDLVLKALEKRRDDRFPSAEEFDRRVVDLKARHAGEEDPDMTRPIQLTKSWLEDAAKRAEDVTPGAQEKVDQQFLPQTTPIRTELPKTVPTPPPMKTEPQPQPPAPREEKPAPSPEPGTVVEELTLLPEEPRRPALAFILGGGAVAIVALLLLLRPWKSATAPEAAAATPAPAAAAPAATAPATQPAARAMEPKPAAKPPAAKPTAVREAASEVSARPVSTRVQAPSPAAQPASARPSPAQERIAQVQPSPQPPPPPTQAPQKPAPTAAPAKPTAVPARPTAPAPVRVAEAAPELAPAAAAAAPAIQKPIIVREIGPNYPQLDTLPPGPDEFEIVLEAVVTETGDVRDVRIPNLQHLVLDRPAIYAVSHWKFKPATLEGKPVAVRIQVTSIIRRTRGMGGNRLKEVSRRVAMIGPA